MTVYLSGFPIFWLAALDLVLFLKLDKSPLGPALDIILMIFGAGLVTISIFAAVDRKNHRNRTKSQ